MHILINLKLVPFIKKLEELKELGGVGRALEPNVLWG